MRGGVAGPLHVPDEGKLNVRDFLVMVVAIDSDVAAHLPVRALALGSGRVLLGADGRDGSAQREDASRKRQQSH